MMKMLYMISMISENKISVLQRITNILARNRLNIGNIYAYEIEQTNNTYIHLTFQSDEKVKSRVTLQLQRIVEVISLNINCQMPYVPSSDQFTN